MIVYMYTNHSFLFFYFYFFISLKKVFEEGSDFPDEVEIEFDTYSFSSFCVFIRSYVGSEDVDELDVWWDVAQIQYIVFPIEGS